MQTSGAGIRFIQSFEELRVMQYKDQGGKWTIIWRHLILPNEDFSAGVTGAQADAMFVSDLKRCAENPVMRFVHVAMQQNQFDALVSICYNIGEGNFEESHLLKYLNEGRPLPMVGDQFIRWDKVNGLVSNGLYARRSAERDIFINNNYVNHK